jgi:DNA-binding transcriptional MerR regulator
MTARTYLSIGDVLTLLREEFPDVTISKIRFLESQGLVNPERSPSGYRKFFDTDVERLRWVLRQQREHFLPLKVIRDRLADGDLGEEEAAPSEATATEAAATEAAASGNGRVSEPARAAVGARGAGSAGRVAASGGTSTATAPPLPPHAPEPSPGQTKADDEAMARILADASRRAARVPDDLPPAIPDPRAPAPPAHVAAAESHVVAPASSVAAAAAAAAAAAEAASGAVDTRSSSRASAPAAPPPTAVAPSNSVRTPRHAPAAAGADAPVSALYPAPPGPGPGPAAADPAHTEHAAPVLADASSGTGTTATGARGTAGRAATGRQGATAPRAAEASAAAPGGKGAGGAAAKAAGAQSAKNVPVSAPPDAAPATPAAATTSTVTGASLTAEELCAASGLSEAELTNLQGFGLIEPIMVAGIPTFDEDALTVANLAAAFRKFGIEARHLRPYRNAVDREVGLIEQVIIPLLRQRNPESRQRAMEAADELGALGQTMRATLMRAALRRHVGG